MVGQMVTTLGLPALKFVRLRRSHAMVAVGFLLGSALVSAGLSSQAMIVCWFIVGAACGALQFLGATTAAAAVNRQSAFTLRLAITLLVGGFAIVAVQTIGGFGGYALLMMQLVIVFLTITGLGLVLYRAPVVPPRLPASVETRGRPSQMLGLVVIFLLFAGQLGFWAYAVQNLQQRGVVLEHLAYAIAFCKTVAGLVLLIGVMRPPDKTKEGLFFPGLVVALGVLGMAISSGALSFLVGLLLWELGLNVLSARLQAAVVQNNPEVAGPWLAGAVFLGAAAGPLLHGMAIQSQLPLAFAAFACFSAFVPVAWSSLRSQTSAAKPR